MLDFALQCCDSEFYLPLAEACARTGECYDELRPMGAQYWFSLPLRLGLAQEYSIVGHWLLLLLSVSLAAAVSRRIFDRQFYTTGVATKVGVWLSLLAVHSLIFWPVMALALADAAAGLLALIGLWLYLLSGERSQLQQALCLGAAGLALGLAVWIRSFYLYPLLVFLGVYIVFWLINRQRRPAGLTLLMALLPVCYQYQATHERYGEWSFISPAQSGTMFSEHLNSDVAGYDTLVPGRPHRYYSSCRYSEGGILAGIFHGDLSGIICLIASRFQFYYASDLRTVYIDDRDSNNLYKYGESLDVAGQWRVQRGEILADSAVSPDGTRNAETLVALAGEGFEVETPVIPQQDGVYTWSLWMWAADDNVQITLRWWNAWAKQFEHQHEVTLTTQPQRFEFSGELKHAVYFLSLLKTPQATASQFHVWGLQIERGAMASPYQFHRDVNQQRNFSKWLGVLNAIVALLALAALFKFAHHGLILPSFFIALIFFQSLIVLPEQRFIVAAHTYIVCLALWLIWSGILALKSRGSRHV